MFVLHHGACQHEQANTKKELHYYLNIFLAPTHLLITRFQTEESLYPLSHKKYFLFNSSPSNKKDLHSFLLIF